MMEILFIHCTIYICDFTKMNTGRRLDGADGANPQIRNLFIHVSLCLHMNVQATEKKYLQPRQA